MKTGAMTRTYAQWIADREATLADLEAKFPDVPLRGIWLDLATSAFGPDCGAMTNDGRLIVEGLVEVMADLHDLYEDGNYNISDSLVRLAELIDERLVRMAHR